MKTAIDRPRRARTDEQKQDRRRDILLAANKLFLHSGFESFSMGELARDACVAKGTLYLYFKTREEVLLALYNKSMSAWCHVMLTELNRPISDAAFIQLFFDTARQEQGFLRLLERLDSVIEHNVSMDILIESKRLMIDCFEQMCNAIESSLGLPRQAAFDLVKSLASLLVGAQQADNGPTLAVEELPDDVRALIAQFSAEDIFISNAVRIIGGIRAELSR